MTNQSQTAHYQEFDALHHLHPFTSHKSLRAGGARVIVRGDGPYLWDSEGKRILDGMSGLWTANVGHSRRELAEAAYEQMLKLPFYNTFFKTTHPPVVELSRKLAEIAPDNLNQVFFGSSGSESNDTAIRLIRHYWVLKGEPKRRIIISRKNAYHGSTIAAGSMSGMAHMHAHSYPVYEGFRHIMDPYWYGESFEGESPEEFGLRAARALEDEILAVGPENVAAFAGEPVQGAGGVKIPPETYWPEVQRIVDKYGILLLADEVITGFGRLGTWFASQYYGIRPNLITFAKAATSGYIPLSGLIVDDMIAGELMAHDDDFHHGYTFSGHPVACAVALKNLQIIEEEGLVPRVKDVRRAGARQDAFEIQGPSARRRGSLRRAAWRHRARRRQAHPPPLRRSRPRRPHLPRSFLPRRLHHARRVRHHGHGAAADLDASPVRRGGGGDRPRPRSHPQRRCRRDRRMSRPVVVIPACTTLIDGYVFDAVGRKYTAAVAEVAECQPLLIPVGPGMSDIGSLLEVADAILLTGSRSNVAPEHYGEEAPLMPDRLDPLRDALTLPLIRAAVERKKPLFAICRGFQELNVALGGSLHQAVHAVDGHKDHRPRYELPLDEMYGPVHEVSLRGRLRDWVGSDKLLVNSLHFQGIARLANGLKPEAFAEDGLVEAARGPDDAAFCLGVQWHPEWGAKTNPASITLFRRFGEAAKGAAS